MIKNLTRGFFTKKFVHFAWMGVVKTGMSVGGLTLTVDILGMAGWTAGIVVTMVITATNWVAIQHFILNGDASG